MSEQTELKPCPFCCGGEARLLHSHAMAIDEYWVRCMQCGVTSSYGINPDNVIAAWNRRAGEAELVALRQEKNEAIGAALAVEQKCYDQAQELAALRKLREACLGEWIRYESGYDRGQTRNDAAIAAALLACDEAYKEVSQCPTT